MSSVVTRLLIVMFQMHLYKLKVRFVLSRIVVTDGLLKNNYSVCLLFPKAVTSRILDLRSRQNGTEIDKPKNNTWGYNAIFMIFAV